MHQSENKNYDFCTALLTYWKRKLKDVYKNRNNGIKNVVLFFSSIKIAFIKKLKCCTFKCFVKFKLA